MEKKNDGEVKKGKKKGLTKFNTSDTKEKFAEWIAFPTLLRKMVPDQIESLGIHPSEIDPLLMIKTRDELAATLGYSRIRLFQFSKEDGFKKLVYKYENNWFSDRTPNVILGLYKAAVKEGDAARAKLWMQIYRDFKEKQELKHTVDLEEIKALTETIKGFLNK